MTPQQLESLLLLMKEYHVSHLELTPTAPPPNSHAAAGFTPSALVVIDMEPSRPIAPPPPKPLDPPANASEELLQMYQGVR